MAEENALKDFIAKNNDVVLQKNYDTLVANLRWWCYDYIYYAFCIDSKRYYLHKAYYEITSAVEGYLLNGELNEDHYSECITE